MSIANNIKRMRLIKGITQEMLGEIVGVEGNSVSAWETGRSTPRMYVLDKLAEYFDVPISSIIGDDIENTSYGIAPTDSPVATAPLYGYVHAGSFEEERIADDIVQLPARVAEAFPNAFFLRVEGDCMDKVYPEGCLVLVDPTRTPWNGCAVAVESDTYECLLRRYYKGNNSLLLSADSFNTGYEDIIIKDNRELRLIGVVVWFQAAEMESES